MRSSRITVRAPRTLRQAQIQEGPRISAQEYCLYIEHEIREADTVDVVVSTFECRIAAGFRLHYLWFPLELPSRKRRIVTKTSS